MLLLLVYGGLEVWSKHPLATLLYVLLLLLLLMLLIHKLHMLILSLHHLLVLEVTPVVELLLVRIQLPMLLSPPFKIAFHFSLIDIFRFFRILP